LAQQEARKYSQKNLGPVLRRKMDYQFGGQEVGGLPDYFSAK
jgi:hypothetical protein